MKLTGLHKIGNKCESQIIVNQNSEMKVKACNLKTKYSPMKNAVLLVGFFLIMVLYNSCSSFFNNATQYVRVKMKNNTQRSVNIWVDGETMGTSNLLAPQEIREKVVTLIFHADPESDFANPESFTVYAGHEGQTLNLVVCEIDYWQKNNGKTIDYGIEFNSDGSFTGF